MISIPVRGGLGTQILSLYAGYALAEETGETIGEVVFNSGGYPPEALANGDIDRVYFDDLLEFANRPNIISKPGTQKTSAFHEPNLSLLFKHWDKLQEKVWLKLQFVKSARELIHIRQGDRTLVPHLEISTLVFLPTFCCLVCSTPHKTFTSSLEKVLLDQAVFLTGVRLRSM
jgi:hypothetical protein